VNYCAVSDAEPAELERMAGLIRHQPPA
jgi:hypothetical protein